MADALLTQEGRSILRLQRSFPYRVETVWGALVNPQRLAQWYPAGVEMEAWLGGAIALDYGHGTKTAGIITAIDGPQLFGFTEQVVCAKGAPVRDGELGETRIELHPEIGGTLMVFRQAFSDRSQAAAYAAGWQVCFDALDQLLAGQPVAHAPVAAEMITEYRKLFALDGAQ